MPVRPRRRRSDASGPQWTPAMAIALSIGPVPLAHDHLDDAALKAGWQRFHLLIKARQRPGTRAWADLHFDAPPDQRIDRPQLRPLPENA